MKVRLLFLIPALVYTGLILYLSLINLADTPVKHLGVSDKVMHGGAYLGLGLLWMLFGLFGFNEKGWISRLIFISLASIAFGIFIEVLQDRLTTYRQFDVYDAFANSLGVIIAALTIGLTRNYLIRLKAKINLDLMKK